MIYQNQTSWLVNILYDDLKKLNSKEAQEKLIEKLTENSPDIDIEDVLAQLKRLLDQGKLVIENYETIVTNSNSGKASSENYPNFDIVSSKSTESTVAIQKNTFIGSRVPSMVMNEAIESLGLQLSHELTSGVMEKLILVDSHLHPYQVLAARNFNWNLKIQILDMWFVFVPPCSIKDKYDVNGKLVNKIPFYMSQSLVTKSIWDSVMNSDFCNKSIEAKTKTDLQDLETFLKEANNLLKPIFNGKLKLDIPSSSQWHFAVSAGAKYPDQAHSEICSSRGWGTF